MRINSIGTNYSVGYAQKRQVKKQQKNQMPTFQGNNHSAKFFGASMAGLGFCTTMVISEFFNFASLGAVLIAGAIGGFMGIHGYGFGRDLDKTIEEGKKQNEKFKEKHHLSDKN